MTVSIYILFALLCLLQVLDVYSTYHVIDQGKGYEANPFMAGCIKRLGLLGGLVLPKIVIFPLLGYVLVCPMFALQAGYAVDARLVIALLAGLIALYVWAVRGNFRILKA